MQCYKFYSSTLYGEPTQVRLDERTSIRHSKLTNNLALRRVVTYSIEKFAWCHRKQTFLITVCSFWINYELNLFEVILIVSLIFFIFLPCPLIGLGKIPYYYLGTSQLFRRTLQFGTPNVDIGIKINKLVMTQQKKQFPNR